MFETNDEKYITRAIGRNEVVLFIGAGFSMEAKNSNGETFPSGWKLAEYIWKYIGYEGGYDGSPLQDLYQAFVNHGSKRIDKIQFLEKHLLSKEIPDHYDVISAPFWYKIYTINIDDILPKVFRRTNNKVRELVYPIDEYKERDQSLEETHLVYLHGKLPCDPQHVIFSGKQYARAGLTEQPLYSHFVYDYATKPTIFIGTDLNEPLFERYIESREGRQGFGESRPKSFLITPKISPVKADILKKEYNVHHVAGTSGEFFAWLEAIKSGLPKKEEILKHTFPSLLDIVGFASFSNVSKKSVYNFAQAFKRVPTNYEIKKERSGYLLGTNPTWNDLHLDLDIPRHITSDLYESIEKLALDPTNQELLPLFTLVGSAGSGKSTILKRLGLTLSQNSVTSFICDSDILPKPHELIDVITAISQKVVLIFDNAGNNIPWIFNILKELKNLEYQPTILISLRSNQLSKYKYYLDPDIYKNNRIDIPDLSDQEITKLIEKLDSQNLLGKLKGMSDAKRFNEFKYRAKKQILVSMKEATNGRLFNDIIKDEFDNIGSKEAQLLCLCIALNSELGYANTKQDFIGFSRVSHIETLNILENELAGTIMWVGENKSFVIRHRMLAEFMIQHCVSEDMLKEAYIRVLSVLAPELIKSTGHSKKFSLYKSLINHSKLYARFESNVEKAREVYDSVTPYLSEDSHFWLQYGSLEMEGNGGDLGLAENYLNQAESISPRSTFIQNAKCNLYYRQSSALSDRSLAYEFKSLADELYAELARVESNLENPYINHIHCKGSYLFIQRWITEVELKKNMLSELISICRKSVEKYPRDSRLNEILILINQAYLSLAIVK